MDRLYLLENEFTDNALSRHAFYCRDCMLLNGLFAAFPEQASKLEIIRVPHARPRQVVTDLLGEDNQSLPVLVLGDVGAPDVQASEYWGLRFVNDFPALLQALHVRHGFPEAHP